jgi:alkaline phosphatase
MTRRRLSAFSLILILVGLLLPAYGSQVPRNVILMIGDGMGFGQITLAELSAATPLNMESMPYTAFVKTQSLDAVTDSAAAGTALATGFKTKNGMIGVLPDGTIVPTILEKAIRLRKAAGLVTTTTITHATPAAFGSHVASRGDEADIAPQFIERRIDVLLGGGRSVFLPKSDKDSARKDDRNLLQEAREAGYTIVGNREDLLSADEHRLLGLFQASSLTTKAPEPSLAEMTGKAIDVLSQDKEGFFLMVEGGQIDWRCHDNDLVGAAKQTLDFDTAVGKALDFARKHRDTLVIVTADHETGGLSLVYPDEGMRIKAKWTTTGHSGCNVPLLAYGPGAGLFTGILDNTDIPKKIARLWGVRDFASAAQPAMAR